MANSRIITVGKKNGTTGAWEPDNSVVNPRIIGVINPSNIVNGSLRTGNLGQYQFDNIPNDFYCFYDGSQIKEEVLGKLADGGVPIFNPFTLPFLKLISGSYFDAESKELKNLSAATGSNSAVILSQLANYLGLGGGTMTGDLDMGNKAINNLPAPTGPLNPLRDTDGTARYIDKRAGTTNQVYSGLILRGTVYYINYPFALNSIVNRKFVEDYCTSILQGFMPSAFQQSANIIRINYSGFQEDNKLYQTLEAGIINAGSYATAGREMVCVIEGKGAGSELANYNLLPVTYNPYVHIHSSVPNNVIRIGEDSYVAGNIGEKILSNVTIAVDGVDGMASLTKYILINCKFTNTPSAGTPTYTLVNCVLINCRQVGSTVNPDSNCVGEIFNETTKAWRHLSGMGIGSASISKDGDIQPRRLLGTKGSNIASASSITLGNGNYFVISGTTTISTINTSGWSNGSIINLYFSGACLIDTGGGNIANQGGDFTTEAGNVYQFILDFSTWIRIK